MSTKPTNIKEYIAAVPADRLAAFKKLRKTIKDNLPKGFKECIVYGMPGWGGPLKTYPDGYHCAKDAPLPFINIANQKNFIALYHMGMYADPKIHKWFTKEYGERCQYKLDMGKSCVRLKKVDDIPYDLVAELMTKFTVDSWIALYEKNYTKK